MFLKMLNLVGMSYAGIRGQPFSGWASLGCVAVAAWSTVHRRVLKPLTDFSVAAVLISDVCCNTGKGVPQRACFASHLPRSHLMASGLLQSVNGLP